MTLPKLTHSATLVSRNNRQRILQGLPATQAELQEKLHLSRSCVSSHITALKKDKAIHIIEYIKASSRGVGGAPHIERYASGKGKDVKRPPLYDDKEWQRRNRNADYNKRQRDMRFLRNPVPKSDPLSVMYARNQTQDTGSFAGN